MTIYSSSKKSELDALRALLLKLAKSADKTDDPKELAPLAIQIRQCLRRIAEIENPTDGPTQQAQNALEELRELAHS